MDLFNSPTENMNNILIKATMLMLFKLNEIATYTPLNPNNFTLINNPNFIKRHIKDNYYLFYSPNCYKIYEKFHILPILFVNYTMPIDYEYYGTEKPPERPIDLQLKDWENGYQLSRMKLPNETITEEKLQEIERKLGTKIQRGWYWVKHHARLIKFPTNLTTLYEGVIKVTYKIPSPLATTPLISNLYELITHEKEKIVNQTVKLLNSIGFEIDNSLQYKIGDKTARGIQILISKDNKYYEVYVPVKKVGAEAEFIQYLIIGAIIIIAICFAFSTYEITDAVITYAQTKEDIEKEKTKQLQIKLNFLANNPTTAEEILKNPDLAKAIFDTATELKENNSEIIKYAEYAGIGLAALIGLIIIYKIVKK